MQGLGAGLPSLEQGGVGEGEDFSIETENTGVAGRVLVDTEDNDGLRAAANNGLCFLCCVGRRYPLSGEQHEGLADVPVRHLPLRGFGASADVSAERGLQDRVWAVVCVGSHVSGYLDV